MSTSSTSYKKVLLVGATSGIGRALADRFIASGSSVIVAGRRLERLNDFVSQHGAAKAFAAQLDLNDTDKLPAFVAKITAEHPDLDCVFLNSGVQNRLDFSKPESVDLKKARNEIDTNYWSQICMTHAFLPWLLKRGQKGETSALMFTSSGLAMVPLPAAIGYCATKAAIHHFIMALRIQLEGKGVKVVELFPPAVQTEMHDYVENGQKIGIPLDEFTDEAWAGISKGDDEVAVGIATTFYNKFETHRKPFLDMMAARTRETSA